MAQGLRGMFVVNRMW